MESPNYDEGLVPAYTLTDPLLMNDGTRVERPDQWLTRRDELLELFARNEYGFMPDTPVSVHGEVVEVHADFLDGAATMKQVDVVILHSGKELRMGVVLFLPNAFSMPVPAFLGLNFYGNHTVHPDSRIRLHSGWVADHEELGIKHNRACDDSRGGRAYRWPIADILGSGNALISVYAGDIDPDFDDGFRNGAHGLFGDEDFGVPHEERWGTISAWSWGLSRILDYIVENEPIVDANHVHAIGHSRMGKAALWAAANDTRFATAISNNSGCAGAALHRRCFGERIHHINTNFPHWLNGRSKAYSCKEDLMPVDQHELLALIAPRPVYVASAAGDLWADPKGEFLSLKGAAQVYHLLFGISDTLPEKFPRTPAAFQGRIGYHLRAGKHDLLPGDWLHFLKFTRAIGEY